MSLRAYFTTRDRLGDLLYEHEASLADPAVRSDRERVEALLHPLFTETGSTGETYDRATMIEMMTSETPGQVMIRDFKMDEISGDVAMVTYRSVGVSGQEVKRTSIWLREDGRWQLRHHQGTRVADRWGLVS